MSEVLLSILIPTLGSRRHMRVQLEFFLHAQVGRLEPPALVEILHLEDEGGVTIGDKRNTMIQQASGRFIVFVDDDDWVHDCYVKLIVDSIRRFPDLDVIDFWGTVSFKGVFAGNMLHSVMCPAWTESPGWYYRPPNHLNPIRRQIAQQFRFPPVRFAEDFAWSMALMKAGVLKNSVFIGTGPMYVYRNQTERRTL